MFTGIIESACTVRHAVTREGRLRLLVDLAPALAAGRALRAPAPGDSVAVNGCCLTIDALDGCEASFDVVEESLRRTNLGQLRAGARVNVERSLAFGDPVDGHLVSGHVEATGAVLALEPTPSETRLTVGCTAEFAGRLLPKGSVAVDGVSLTIATLHSGSFEIALVPHTLRRTTLGERRVGDRVNLEPDLIGQWVARAVERGAR